MVNLSLLTLGVLSCSDSASVMMCASYDKVSILVDWTRSENENKSLVGIINALALPFFFFKIFNQVRESSGCSKR